MVTIAMHTITETTIAAQATKMVTALRERRWESAKARSAAELAFGKTSAFGASASIMGEPDDGG